eukprot:887633-Amphidinium_carterae.1
MFGGVVPHTSTLLQELNGRVLLEVLQHHYLPPKHAVRGAGLDERDQPPTTLPSLQLLELVWAGGQKQR